MVTVEEIMSDPRFRINTQEPLRLFKEKISKYEIVKIKLGDLFCYYGEGLLKLEETAIYKFLDASVDGRCLYENYCKCHPTNFRNTANYEQLIKNLDTLEYDIKKGAIVINQHDIIIDGQHRSSILLKKYGPNYLVDVVKIHYSKHLIGLKWLKIKRLIMGGDKAISFVSRHNSLETFFVNLCIKLQGGELNSSLLRKYYAQKYKVYVDKYSYGAFTPGFNFGGTSVRVGRYCSIAGDVRYFGGNHPMGEFSTSPIFYNPNLGYCTNNDIERHSLIIEDDVWIGYGVKITSGCKVIGRGAVIGAGSVVTKDVKPYTIVAGMPAKVIRNRYASEFVALFDQSNWWQLPPEALISMKNEATDIKDFCGKVINFFENGYN